MTTSLLQRKLDIDDVADRLRRAGVSSKCSVCASDSGYDGWVIADEYVSVVPWRGTQFVFDGGYPCVLVSCGVCGHTSLFNAHILGLMD